MKRILCLPEKLFRQQSTSNRYRLSLQKHPLEDLCLGASLHLVCLRGRRSEMLRFTCRPLG